MPWYSAQSAKGTYNSLADVFTDITYRFTALVPATHSYFKTATAMVESNAFTVTGRPTACPEKLYCR